MDDDNCAFITVISVLLAFHLKQHYDQITNENHANKDKINIKNKMCAFYQRPYIQ